MPCDDLIHHECNKKFEDGKKRMDKLETKTTEMHTALIGDYEKPGLKTVVVESAKNLKKLIDKSEKEAERKIDWERWAERTVIGALFAVVIYFIQIKIGS